MIRGYLEERMKMIRKQKSEMLRDMIKNDTQTLIINNPKEVNYNGNEHGNVIMS